MGNTLRLGQGHFSNHIDIVMLWRMKCQKLQWNYIGCQEEANYHNFGGVKVVHDGEAIQHESEEKQ